MKIYKHARENYIKRVLNLEMRMASEEVEQFALEQIEKAVYRPDIIYASDDDREQVHIRNGCAVPVRKDGDELSEVPTAYNAGTFFDKIDDYAESAKARN